MDAAFAAAGGALVLLTWAAAFASERLIHGLHFRQPALLAVLGPLFTALGGAASGGWRRRAPLRAHLACGVLLFVSFWAGAQAQQLLPFAIFAAAKAGRLVFTMGVGAVWLRKVYTLGDVTAAALAIVGLALTLGLGTQAHAVAGAAAPWRGIVLVTASLLADGVYANYQEQLFFQHGASTGEVACLSHGTALALLVAQAAQDGASGEGVSRAARSPALAGWLTALALCGWASTSVALGVIKRWGVARTSFVLTVAKALAVAVSLAGSPTAPVAASQCVGIVLVFASVLLSVLTKQDNAAKLAAAAAAAAAAVAAAADDRREASAAGAVDADAAEASPPPPPSSSATSPLGSAPPDAGPATLLLPPPPPASRRRGATAFATGATRGAAQPATSAAGCRAAASCSTDAGAAQVSLAATASPLASVDSEGLQDCTTTSEDGPPGGRASGDGVRRRRQPSGAEGGLGGSSDGALGGMPPRGVADAVAPAAVPPRRAAVESLQRIRRVSSAALLRVAIVSNHTLDALTAVGGLERPAAIYDTLSPAGAGPPVVVVRPRGSPGSPAPGSALGGTPPQGSPPRLAATPAPGGAVEVGCDADATSATIPCTGLR